MKSIRDGVKLSFSSICPNPSKSSGTQAETLLPTDEPIDEETIPGYVSRDYYPVIPGDVFNDRYKILVKIGWGGSSTVWLARDTKRHIWQGSRLVAVKVHNSSSGLTDEAAHERDIERHIANQNPLHRGHGLIRTHIDCFGVPGPQGRHLCLVYEPMREPVWLLRQRLPDGKFPLSLVKAYIFILLHGLDYLHSECRVVHTDLKLENILVSCENTTLVKDFVKRQVESGLRRKIDTAGRVVYLSQDNFGPLSLRALQCLVPIITDFGHAQRIISSAFGISPIQPDHYRAPEVILGCGWTYSADIWNLGLLMWSLLEGKDLFRQVYDDQGRYNSKAHLAEMVALLGTPPPRLLERSEERLQYRWLDPIENPEGKLCHRLREYFGGPFFDKKGRFLHKKLIPNRKLEDTIPSLTDKEKNAFLTFAKKMLAWLPEERKTAEELLEDPFFEGMNEG